MNRSDNIRLLQELTYRRRRMAWRAGGVVAAIALSSCIGTGVAYADELVVDTSDQQAQAALVQDVQGTSDDQQAADVAADDSSEEAAASEVSNEQQKAADADQEASADATDTAETKAQVDTAATSTTAADNGTLADDSAVKDASGETIEAFDLRHATEDTDGTLTSDWKYTEGDSQSSITGGTSYVTPVKLQNPWGTCWAFSGTAASETSLLTELDKADDGEMNGSISYEVAAAWAKLDEADDGILNGSIDYGSVSSDLGLLAEEASDLSERYLAWFSFYDVTEDSPYPDQAGEGDYLVDGTKSDTTIYNAGGMPWLCMSEYSSGLGPVPEYMAPYMNEAGMYQVPTTEFNTATRNFNYVYFASYEEAVAYSQATWTEDAIKQFNEKYGTQITAGSVVARKATVGDWSLDDSDAYCVVAELSNSNVLDQNLRVQGLSVEEIVLMKQELLEGHAISIGYAADQSKPGQVLAGNTYLNTETWAQYTYDANRITHAVTIVGYDDNYDASNFTHDIYKTDSSGKIVYDDAGNPVVDEEKTALTTPAGNGAWIVKNSWGSLDAEDAWDLNNWGIDGSGYFYLSYYDKTISHMESYEYDVSEEAQARLGYVSYQYDLANVNEYTQKSTENVSKMCNVFNGPETGEGCVSIRDLGFVTGYAGDTATLEVYVMDDDEDVVSVINAGNPVVTVTQTFTNSGFHRIHLDSAIKVLPNQKFAIVQTIKEADNSFEYVIMDYINEEFATAYNAAMSPVTAAAIPYYLKTVVNAGESLIMKDGDSWQDWLDVMKVIDVEATANEIKAVRAKADDFLMLATLYRLMGNNELAEAYEQVAKNCKNFTVGSTYAYDNFSIKAYADVSDIEIPAVELEGVEQTAENQKAFEDTCAAIADSLYQTGELPSYVKEVTTGAVKRAINAGDGLIAELKAVKAAADEVSGTDKDLIALAIQFIENGEEVSEVLQYFNIDCLLKNATTGDVLAYITQTDSPISFAIQLDSDVLERLAGHECYLVRTHNGESTVLDFMIENGVLKFKSDLFSAYALVMLSEAEPEPVVNEETTAQTQVASYSEGTASPKTGDDSTAAVGFFGALAALSSAVLLRLRRRA